jgi:hypothetical protein
MASSSECSYELDSVAREPDGEPPATAGGSDTRAPNSINFKPAAAPPRFPVT